MSNKEGFSYEEDGVLFLSVQPEHSGLAGGLDSGRYHFDRYQDQWEQKSPVRLRELVELLLEISADFGPLRDCWKGGKVLGAEACEVLLELSTLHRDPILCSDYSDFFLRFKRIIQGARDGVLVFH